MYDDSDHLFPFFEHAGMELSSHRPAAVSTGHSDSHFFVGKKSIAWVELKISG